MAFAETDPVLFMQAQMSRLFRKRHNMSIDDFNKLERKTGLLDFIEIGYEPFHLTGEEGVLDELDDFCKKRLSEGENKQFFTN
jgi:hypothetical protein